MLPAGSETRTWRVLLPVRVCAVRDQVLLPVVAMAVDHVLPLSSETSTNSPLTRLAEVVPEMVWDAVLVLKSVLEVPVSAEKATDAIVVVGGMPSTTKAAFAASEPIDPGLARVRMALLPAASLMVPPLRAKALLES